MRGARSTLWIVTQRSPGRRWRAAAALALALCVAACARVPLPWQRPALVAEVWLRGPDLDVRGRVTFARPPRQSQPGQGQLSQGQPGQGRAVPDRGTLQLDVIRDGHADNATLLPSGGKTAFTDGVPRALRDGEQRALAVLAAWLAWPGAEGDRKAAGSEFAVTLPDGARYSITVTAEVEAPAHHAVR